MKGTGLNGDFLEETKINLNGLYPAHSKSTLCRLQSLRRIKQMLIRTWQPMLTMSATFQADRQDESGGLYVPLPTLTFTS